LRAARLLRESGVRGGGGFRHEAFTRLALAGQEEILKRFDAGVRGRGGEGARDFIRRLPVVRASLGEGVPRLAERVVVEHAAQLPVDRLAGETRADAEQPAVEFPRAVP